MELNVNKVMARLEKRFNPVLNEKHQYRPKFRHKTATATITRAEYECLYRELQELITFQEANLLKDEAFEQLHNNQEG